MHHFTARNKSRLNPADTKKAWLVYRAVSSLLGELRTDVSMKDAQLPSVSCSKVYSRAPQFHRTLMKKEEKDRFMKCCKRYSFPKVSKFILKYHIHKSENLKGSTIKTSLNRVEFRTFQIYLTSETIHKGDVYYHS